MTTPHHTAPRLISGTTCISISSSRPPDHISITLELAARIEALEAAESLRQQEAELLKDCVRRQVLEVEA